MDVRPTPEQAKREFVAWFGGMAEIGDALRARMRQSATEILGREPADGELQRWSRDLLLRTLARWPEATEGTAPEAHLDRMVETWAGELRQQVRLNCWDVLLVPIFAVMIPAGVLSTFLPDWAAFLGGIVLAVPTMKWWIWARRTGRIALGDD